MIQTRLLGVLRDRRPAINELAKLLGLDKSSTSGLVDRAERRGLVTRNPSAPERLSVLVSLTDNGRALVTDVAAHFEADVSTPLDPLPASQWKAPPTLLSRLVVTHAAEHCIDLFATVERDSRG